MPKCHLETGSVKLCIKPALRMESFTISCFLFKYSWKPVQIEDRDRYTFQVTTCLTEGPLLLVVTVILRKRSQGEEVKHAGQIRAVAWVWHQEKPGAQDPGLARVMGHMCESGLTWDEQDALLFFPAESTECLSVYHICLTCIRSQNARKGSGNFSGRPWEYSGKGWESLYKLSFLQHWV